jgi:hypothetical protein
MVKRYVIEMLTKWNRISFPKSNQRIKYFVAAYYETDVFRGGLSLPATLRNIASAIYMLCIC